jgi:APA family basic amino acid/polyamine antiporter
MDLRSLIPKDTQSFKTKTIDKLMECTSGKYSLRKVLSPLDLTLMGIGAIIGTGIFVITGVVAANYSGPALVVSFVIAGIVCAFAALAYAEFAAMVPVSGSAYTYSYASLGEIWAWIIGWDLILEYGVSIAAVAVGWSGYATNLIEGAGITLPAAFINPTGTNGGLVNLPAMVIILLVSVILIIGVRESARVNMVIVAIKLAVIFLFLYLTFGHIRPANWVPFMPFGWNGVITGAAIVFFAYIGFDAVSTAAEEVKNPKRDIPIGILSSLAIATVLYIAVSAVLTGIVPYTLFAGTSAPVAFALEQIGISWGSALISFGAICGITSVILVLLYGQTRIFFAMSRDGLLPELFRQIHPVYRTPVKVTILVGTVTALLAGFLPLTTIAELVNIGTLAAFIIVSLGVIVLRYTQPTLPRPFKCPFVPYVPILCILSCGLLILALPLITHLRFVLWLAVGLVIYILYSRHNSRINDDTSALDCWKE